MPCFESSVMFWGGIGGGERGCIVVRTREGREGVGLWWCFVMSEKWGKMLKVEKTVVR